MEVTTLIKADEPLYRVVEDIPYEGKKLLFSPISNWFRKKEDAKVFLADVINEKPHAYITKFMFEDDAEITDIVI